MGSVSSGSTIRLPLKRPDGARFGENGEVHVSKVVEAWRQAGSAKRYVRRRRQFLARAWEYERDLDHLVPSPVFVMCSVRSGSTLLRSMLDTHTQICAPHELHLGTMRLTTDQHYAVDSWDALGLSVQDLENMLWDRALHRMLVSGGGRIIVDKTPQNAMLWQRIHEFWPDARYLHLRRHPGAIVKSLDNARPDTPHATNVQTVKNYGKRLNTARDALPGLTVRYEDLTTDPEAIGRSICDYLDVKWQPRMLKYKRGGNRAGLGDWSSKIKSGRVQPHDELPSLDEVDAGLRPLVEKWGY